ncbi:MAG: NAD(P)-binding domain-containing protein [Haloarculaceae archaeon]
MDVSILGTGNVGSALASGLSAAGHDVTLGSRDPDTADVATAGVDVVTQRVAAERGDVVVLALPSAAVVDVAADLEAALAGKPVVDAANEYPTARAETPLAARIADAAPEAHVVKAFNTTGSNLMTDPVVDGEHATMFVAGDDESAVETVETLAADLGFDPVVAGGLDAAGHLEHLARFWISLSQEYGRDIAFRLLQDRTAQ